GRVSSIPRIFRQEEALAQVERVRRYAALLCTDQWQQPARSLGSQSAGHEARGADQHRNKIENGQRARQNAGRSRTMADRQEIHVHVDRDEPTRRDDYVVRDDYVAAEEARAAGFFGSQLLWLLVIALIIVLIAAALGTGVVDFSGESASVDPTVAP